MTGPASVALIGVGEIAGLSGALDAVLRHRRIRADPVDIRHVADDDAIPGGPVHHGMAAAAAVDIDQLAALPAGFVEPRVVADAILRG